MSRNIVFEKKYSIDNNKVAKKYWIPDRYYRMHNYTDDYQYGSSISIVSSLDADIDVFDSLPVEIYNNEDVSLFLYALRKVINKEKPKDITLSKLLISEQTPTGVTLDWIYNYFRIYFSFDSVDGDFFGCISHNPEDGSFKNEFKQMQPTQFEDVAQAMLDYVITMIKG